MLSPARTGVEAPSRAPQPTAAAGRGQGDGSGGQLVLHWGGPRHGQVDHVPPELLTSAVLVYDGPRWFGVYQRFQPVQVQDTAQGPAEIWVVRE